MAIDSALLSAPPVLSTPAAHIFENAGYTTTADKTQKHTDEQIHQQYEIAKTIKDIRDGGWHRIALQFEDYMLSDSVQVYQQLLKGLTSASQETTIALNDVSNQLDVTHISDSNNANLFLLFILGDTSYGACCVDEIAAEHVDAQVVVHYGRSCLSPTARLPVIYVFTAQNLDYNAVSSAFEQAYPQRGTKVLLVSDAPYQVHQESLYECLKASGYTNIFSTRIIHDTTCPIPNRTIPDEAIQDVSILRDYQLFFVGKPPDALLLTLSSRVGSVRIFDGTSTGSSVLVSSKITLRRRYALVTSLSTTAVFGILINTLSVKRYLHVVDKVKAQIEKAGKQAYTFVVGKVNAAKVANFSEIGGWVVIGCWESSLIESSGFFRPLITPFELGLSLQADTERIWTGEWTSNFEAILREPAPQDNGAGETEEDNDEVSQGSIDSDEESVPPEYDLRTGRYISHSRPLQQENRQRKPHKAEAESGPRRRQAEESSGALVARGKGDLTQIRGAVSSGAEFLKSQRTWQGLGSDFVTDFTNSDSNGQGAVITEGRSGVARGYTVGNDNVRT